MEWQPIDTAPIGPVPGEDAERPEYPRFLLATTEGAAVGYYDYYYHEGYGMGAGARENPWCENISGEPLYPTHWMKLPELPNE